MAISYNRIPLLNQWKKDSSTRMSRRKNDNVLLRIDSLLKAVETCPNQGAREVLRGDLYFALDFWLKNKNTSNKDRGREPAVYALFTYIANSLSRSLNVSINVLPRELEMLYGRTMGNRGTMLDRDEGHAKYLSRAEVLQYAISWANGKAYQFPHWQPNASKSKRVIANTAHLSNPGVNIQPGYSGFAMSMSQTIYVAKHHMQGSAHSGNFHYHSSYLGGESVLCAGTIKIEQGVVKAIRTNSGHYQPLDEHMLNVVKLLQTVGAPIQNIDIESHNGQLVSKASYFLASQGNWQALMKRKQANISAHQKKVQGTIDRIDRYLYDLWQNGYYLFQGNENYYYNYVCRTYGWSRQLAWQYTTAAFNKYSGSLPKPTNNLSWAHRPPGKPR